MSDPTRVCQFGDPFCPCQDGDACHYVAYPWEKEVRAMAPPTKEQLAEWALWRAEGRR